MRREFSHSGLVRPGVKAFEKKSFSAHVRWCEHGAPRRSRCGLFFESPWNVRASQEEFEKAAGRTADPSTSLRFGRDDKGERGGSGWSC
jgi:hypothetical protein